MSKHSSTFQPCTQHPAPSNSSGCSHHLHASPTLHLTSAASYMLALLTPLLPHPHLFTFSVLGPLPRHSSWAPLYPVPGVTVWRSICSLSTNHFLGPKKEGLVVGVGSKAKAPLGSRG